MKGWCRELCFLGQWVCADDIILFTELLLAYVSEVHCVSLRRLWLLPACVNKIKTNPRGSYNHHFFIQPAGTWGCLPACQSPSFSSPVCLLPWSWIYGLTGHHCVKSELSCFPEDNFIPTTLLVSWKQWSTHWKQLSTGQV